MEDFNVDKPRKKYIESETLAVIKTCSQSCAPVNLRDVVIHIQEKYNVNLIKTSELEDGLSGFLTKEYNIYDEEVFTIGFNANHPWVRNRFTIAHEIGHLVLGHVCNKNASSKTNEKEADLFASYLLMPKDLLKKDFLLTPSQKDLAKKYIVSESAMTIRLMESKILKF
jgi:Zn-dependent peptidase ImmA (M78 family)